MKMVTYTNIVNGVTTLARAYARDSNDALPDLSKMTGREIIWYLEFCTMPWMVYGQVMALVDDLSAELRFAALEALNGSTDDTADETALQQHAESIASQFIRAGFVSVFRGQVKSTSDSYRMASEARIEAYKAALHYVFGIDSYTGGMVTAMISHAAAEQARKDAADAIRPHSAQIGKEGRNRFHVSIRNRAGDTINTFELSAHTRVDAAKEVKAMMEANNTPWCTIF